MLISCARLSLSSRVLYVAFQFIITAPEEIVASTVRIRQRCKNVTLGVISPHYLLLPILVRAMELREDIVTLTETTASAQSKQACVAMSRYKFHS